MENYLGETAALAGALCFSLASTTFTLAGRKFGASVSMALSLVISLAFLLPLHLALQGEIFPFGTSPQRWLMLGLSSLAGFVISALMLLRAFQYIGPRLTLLVGATSPIYATAMAWLFLDQGLPNHAILGILLVISGVVAVVSEDPAGAISGKTAEYRKGLALAFGAAFAQGASFILMSEGLAGDYPAMSASLIRTVVGLVLLCLFIGIRGKLRYSLDLISTEPRSLALIVLASLAGPVAGGTLVLLSLQFTSVGISSTLTGTTPIFLIPISFIVFGERITLRACIGTVLAVLGVALLFAA